LPLGPKPILQVDPKAKILIIGQAPGIKAHMTGIPWNDDSGVRLREWLGISKETFYDKSKVAIMPMGFCYPGKGPKGDLPPRKECFPAWHAKLLKEMPDIKLIFLVGKYAQDAYLKKTKKKNLTETVRAWREYLPLYIPLPHSSPLNNIWLSKNSWFKKDLKEIQKLCNKALK